MACICVDGPAVIYAGPMDCTATAVPNVSGAGFYNLGVTENGIQISIGGQAHRVMSDDMGGSEGMPAEILYMGATASIRGVLVKYNGENLAAIVSGLNNYGATEGTIDIPGTPVFAGQRGFSIVVMGRQKTFYFPKCEFVSQPREFNISSTERKTSFTATAYPVYDSNCQGHLYFVDYVGSSSCPGCADAYGGAVPPSGDCLVS